ncbi:MAG TPA: PLP-dependent aminotransferase family protein [Baekduia sp.]|nr:PLP-dependent aminotransferase family protein [Baekduia sp.]
MSYSLFIALDPMSSVPMHRQLSDAIRKAIVEDRLKAGTRLPSTRTLGEELRVSRNTILEAFSQLRAEGYLEARIGSGTYVACRLPERTMSVAAAPTRRLDVARPPATLSRRGRLLRTSCEAPGAQHAGKLAFDPAKPADDLFPAEAWRRLMARRWSQYPDRALERQDPGGYAPLREAIAQHACATRGLACEPEQVVIVSGERQGLDLAARVLTDPGDRVWFEDPGSPHARNVLALGGADLIPVPVDEDGIDVGAGVRAAADARMAYVCPSVQYPLARTMSLERRAALLDWAGAHDAWVIEDDRDCEFRYSGRPLPAVQAMDAADRVIYMGSFARVLAPALRMAYLIVPRPLVDVFVAGAACPGGDMPTIDQAVLADFLAGGHFVRHLRRLRATYDHRRDVLLDQLETRLGDLLHIAAAPAGTHVVAHLPAALADTVVAKRCAAVNLVAPALSDHAVGRSDLNGVLLGFAPYSDPVIRYGSRCLAEVVHAASASSSSYSLALAA